MSDKKDLLETFDEVNERHFLNARLETLNRIRQNLLYKIREIDGKIHELRREDNMEIPLEP
ncbi:hypothetical protein GF325_08610 [Candidatus Bathyarchaeota archaeon]|nr:hypothetical protein [Candidatus Bathyarchaeota archaeon]